MADLPVPAPPQHNPSSPAQLANILSSVLAENENLRRDVAAAKHRYERAEHLLSLISPPADNPSSSRSPPRTTHLPDHTVQAIRELEASLAKERAAREDADARLRALSDVWTELDIFLRDTEGHAVSARASFSQALRDPATKLLLTTSASFPPASRRTAPPPPPRSAMPSFAPPPHVQNALPPPPSRIRHRADSMEDMHPPAKRLRADRSGRYPHETSVRGPPPFAAPEPNHQLHAPYSHHSAHPRVHASQPRGRRPTRSPSLSPLRSRTRSRSSSMSLDEMLLQVATNEPRSGSPGSAQAPFPSYYRPDVSRRSLSPGDYRLPPVRPHPSHSGTSPSLAPSQVQYQTHIFAPPVTGPPGKKSKSLTDKAGSFVETASSVNSGVRSLAGAGSLPPGGYPATNDKGQRICRQCGMPGRYRDGKCVEKWGPGPEGPGTVCDRCRKKMKRVERRGTLETQVPLSRAPTLAQSQSQSHAHLPLHRSDTVVFPHAHAVPPRKLSDSSSSLSATRVHASPHSHNGENGHGRVSSSEVDAEGEAEDELDPEGEGEGEGDGDADGDVEGEDADADLLEAVDAAEGNNRDVVREKEKVPWVKREGDAVGDL
ncbi:hypothetical protein FA95DRAFT_1554591 [Auriscalpium vulgare]|uniref:Uncharacterized protein n=1 Tax=Auriscalpium vulgare TaxID=40419 RepID=A0ACB8S5Q9_9AGAM|nr:hypothetical protein FA95DRAFT_1554591 [Auriscalpium vulgare]